MELTYDEIDNSIDNLWSVLFATGYITQEEKAKDGVYKLVIPNSARHFWREMQLRSGSG